MRIPLGNFGDAVPNPPPSVQYPIDAFGVGKAVEQLGNTGMQVAAQMMEDQRALNRAKGANDFQDYQIAVKTASLDLAPLLADGTISSADAPGAYKKAIAEIPKPDTSYLDPVTAENVSRGINQAQAQGLNDFQPIIAGAMVFEQKAAVDQGMDKLAKLAGMPGADPAAELAKIEIYNDEGVKAYGKNWALKKQEFMDRAWFDVAQARIQQVTGNIPMLEQIQADLNNTKDGTYADKLDTNKRTVLLAQVGQHIRGAHAEEIQLRAEQARQLAIQQDQTMQGYLVQMNAHSLTVKDVLNNPVLDFSQKEHFVNALKSQANKQDTTDPGTFSELFNRIHAEPGSKKAITSADQLYPYMGKGISFTDMARLRGELDGKSQPEGEMLKNFKKMAQDQIDASTLFGKDPVGAQKFYEWNIYFDQQLAEQRKAGKSVHDLLDPTSKDYLGKTISGFTRTLAQQTADIAATMGGKGKPAALTTPLKNAKGWALQIDAKGNKAYVSSDGKQFEEVK